MGNVCETQISTKNNNQKDQMYPGCWVDAGDKQFEECKQRVQTMFGDVAPHAIGAFEGHAAVYKRPVYDGDNERVCNNGAPEEVV